ncbi:NAD(P)-dependent oxidoreductase [Deinococcus deserti]|uniref:Putative NAD dependent epimerase/dehydratase family n=1 Tax=Deinococcus deserti (strain DSM 17065 / CIP 109153 / LMG 22923 / VCD115) TaxID=546414 RepID=C1D3I6_DEIDV|nr:NAD(P)-dependent oxidoreductase [Deinococcus deserti]ACO48065.1 putative NAD dependent epimerase/dehydratase family [Deinococcus deserti VCD115]
MNILLIGATGFLGTRILHEALNRGHTVTALVRREHALTPAPNLHIEVADASLPSDVARLATGTDAIIASVSARKPGDTPIPTTIQAIADGARQAGTPRLFVVGGAGSLEVAPGVALMDAPGFPDAYRTEAEQHGQALAFLRGSDLNWTYLSPAAEIAPGERTGTFRLGGNQFFTDAEGRSFITAEDYAVAVLNELEHPQHERQRFSIAY